MIRKNKKGLSEVVSAVLILALVVVLVGIVWAVINNLVKDKLSETGSCFDTFGKVTINSRYTCYNSTSNEFQFSINVGDISLNEVLIGISASGTSTSLRLDNKGAVIPNLVNYPSRSTNITLPKKNAGLTYLFNMGGGGLSGAPDSIRIAPVIGNDQCEVSDALEKIDNCLALIP